MKKFKSLFALLLVVGLLAVTIVGCAKNEGPNSSDIGEILESYYKMTIEKNDDFEDYMGSVSIAQGTTRFKAGEDVTILVEAYEGFAIQSAYLGYNNITSELRKGKGSYTFKATCDRTIRVNFVDENELEYAYLLDLSGFKSYQADVKVTPQKDGYNEGDEITISVTEKEACTLKSFAINGEDLTSKLVNNSYTLVVDGDLDVDIKFTEDYTIIKHASVETFDDELDVDIKVLVDFYAPWCNPCVNVLGPVIDELVPKGKVKVVKVEIQDINYNPYPEQALFSRFAAKYDNAQGSIPFILLFENGKDVKGFTGAFNKLVDLEKWLGI